MSMNLNSTNMLFKLMLMLSTILVLTNSMWLSMWLYLEINLISFIYLLINYKNYSYLESSLIYFMIQTIASILLLFGLIYLNILKNSIIIIIMSLMLKLALSPFHYWMIIIIDLMKWEMILLLLTWQKISPLILLYLYNYYNNLIIFILMSLIIGSMMGLNFSSLKKIIGYSSINQLGWMIISILMINKMFKLYIIIYMMMMMISIYSFKMFNIKYIYNLLNMNNNYYLMFIYCNLLSLGGLPPFIGFFLKLMIINNLNNNFMMMLMTMMSMFSLFYYLRIMISLMMINNKMNNKIMMNNKNNKIIMIMMMMSNTILLLLIINY